MKGSTNRNGEASAVEASTRPERHGFSRAQVTEVRAALAAEVRLVQSSPSLHPATWPRLANRLAVTTVMCLCIPVAQAQGCAGCLDSTRATPPKVQAAYRHAIYLLGGAAGTLFVSGTLLLRRFR